MAKLTKRSIAAFRYRGGWDVRWDNEIPRVRTPNIHSSQDALTLLP